MINLLITFQEKVILKLNVQIIKFFATYKMKVILPTLLMVVINLKLILIDKNGYLKNFKRFNLKF